MKRARNEDSPSSLSHVSPDDSRRLPKISRKVHACTECQARKIKCDVGPDRAVCTRCSRKDLRCIVNKSLQSLLEEGSEWKSTMQDESQCLQRAVSQILQVLELPPLESFASPAAPQVVSPEAIAERLLAVGPMNPRTAAMAMTREHSLEPESSKRNDALASAPMESLYEVTKLRNLRNNPTGGSDRDKMAEDFISKGKISLAEAEELFGVFSRSLNHYLWGGIALVHDNLASVRQSSSLLLAAILTVTALHIPGRGPTFDICYAELITIVCDSMFERYHVLDGVRGLCIGAFWLSDVSWKLSGHAVRIATELNLHQSYSRALRGSTEHIEGARLWYFLYVCDHHFSIAYGRPPVIHENETITYHEKFLELPQASQADFRLHSQVAIFIILTKVYNAFGPDLERVLSENDLVQLRQFNDNLDLWHVKWEPLLAPNPYVSTYPAKGVLLHQHFGKLQVSSLALRGIQHSSDLTLGRKELARSAIESAMTILQMVLNDTDVRNSVVGVPIYLSTMITYATVFLLRIQQKWGAFNLGIDPVVVRDLVTRMIDLLHEARAGERHLTGHMAAGLGRMLNRFTAWEAQEQAAGAQRDIPLSSQLQQPRFDLRADYSNFGMFDNSLPLYDQHYFPMGFFDVMAPTFEARIAR